MNTVQLSCFLAVVETLNFARAAEQLHVTQPAVTQQIHTLERELGVPVTPVAQDGYELLDAMCGLEVPPMEQVQLREETEYFQYNPGAR